jgi:hypothetical protein
LRLGLFAPMQLVRCRLCGNIRSRIIKTLGAENRTAYAHFMGKN